jgi:hypothetical protein
MASSGKSAYQIAGELNQLGIPSPLSYRCEKLKTPIKKHFGLL